MTAAYSVAFDPLGTKIYAGLKHEIRYVFLKYIYKNVKKNIIKGKLVCFFFRIFDVSIPGRDFLESRVLWTKKEGGDQPGIVSCIAVSFKKSISREK